MRRWLDVVRLRVQSLLRADRADADLARELRSHLEEEVAANLAAGMTPHEARRAAHRAFGSTASVEEACRDTRRVTLVHDLWRDLRHGWRVLSRQPLLFVAAAGSIALGAGATLVVYSLGNHLLLSVPTADRPDELVHVRTGNGSHVSFEAWRELDASDVLAGVAGYQIESSVNWRGRDATVPIVPLLVTGNFFDVVGVPVAAGPGITAAEATLDRDPRFVVMSHGFWQRRLGADPAVVGRTLTLNGEAYTIRGILPAGLRSFPGYGLAPDVYLPINRALMPQVDQPEATVVMLVGRLRESQSVDEARAAVATVLSRLGDELGDREVGVLTDLSRVGGLSQVRDFQAIGAFFVVLLVVAALVLAIACANVAGLLLSRAMSRRREVAMRVALGASRARLVQQFLTEGLVLAAVGVLGGMALVLVADRALSLVSLPIPVPLELHAALDGRLVVVAFGLVALTTVLCGLAPAVRATRPALVPSLRHGERGPAPGRLRMRRMLVTGQVAVSLVLLVTALIFVRNLASAGRLDPGFDVANVAVAEVTFVEGRQGSVGAPTAADLVTRLGALPGVEAAAFALGVPLTLTSGGTTGTEIEVDGLAPTHVEYKGNEVGPGYFAAMGIEVLSGRDFTAADRPGAPAVVIVNETFVRRYLAGVDPIGARLTERHRGEAGSATIVGVVANGKYVSLGEAESAALYRPALQGERARRLTHLLVRTATDPGGMAPAIRAAIQAGDPSAAVTVQPMASALAFAFLPSRVGALLLGALGALGTLLAMVGLYGVVAFAVSRRTSEIGIRVALGASRLQVLALVMREGGTLVAVGFAAGLGVAAFVTRPLAAFLVAGLSPLDPVAFAGTVLVLALVCVVAVWSPARRALGVEPAVALRHD